MHRLWYGQNLKENPGLSSQRESDKKNKEIIRLAFVLTRGTSCFTKEKENMQIAFSREQSIKHRR